METWNVGVLVRSPGAIGSYWLKEFQVQTKVGASINEVKAGWFEQYGGKWDFYRFSSLQLNRKD